MNKTDLVNAVSAKAGLSKADSKKAVEATIEAITEAIKAGEDYGFFKEQSDGVKEYNDALKEYEAQVRAVAKSSQKDLDKNFEALHAAQVKVINAGKDLLDILESMNDDIANEKDIDKGKSEALKNAFSEKEGKWIMIVDHEILDEIEDGVEECVSYYNENEKTDFNSSFGKLKSHIEDLYKREEISLVNIL